MEHQDEVRDLFIRLQQGTALGRQQIRDAWPGTIGPAIEALAGKLDRTPACELFRLVDKRGQRLEDERDSYVADRQFCAQLLTLFLSRERDPLLMPSIGAPELDGMYHENTTLDIQGPAWSRFKTLLNQTAKIVELAGRRSTTDTPQTRRKYRKLDVIALFLLLQDITKSDLFKLDVPTCHKLAAALLRDTEHLRSLRSTEGSELKKYYEAWRRELPEDIGVRRDSRRLFADDQRIKLWDRDNGVCQMCKHPVPEGEDEYDHFPVPWRDGGPTEIHNGRLVCKGCHVRGEHSDDWRAA